MSRTRLLGSVLLGVIVLALAVFIANRLGFLATAPKPEPPPAARAEPDVIRFPAGSPQLSSLRAEAAAAFPVPLAEPLNARIAYDENVTTRLSAPIAGRITRLNAEAGDRVSAGQALALLDAPELATAIADVDKAAADEARKRTAFDRAKTLTEGGVAPRKDLENADADLRQAAAEAQRARSRLRNLARGQTASAEGGFALRAPLAGIVVERKANLSMEVRPDLPDPLFVVTDPTRLWVLIDLPERAIAQVEVGQEVAIEVDAYPKTQFFGRIARVAETIDPQTRRVQVRATVANAERKLKPEMYARVVLLADRNKTALRIANAAIITEGVTTFIFVEREPGVYQKRTVTLSIQDREHAYVAEGLAAGERVVSVGALLLNSELKSGT